MALLPSQVEGKFGNRQTALLNGILRGGECVGYEAIAVTDGAVQTLTVPAGASYALLVVEADATSANLDRAINFTEDGTDPTNTAGTNLGLPLGDNGTYSIKNTTNLGAFKMIGREAGKTHTVKVQYYA